MLIILVNQTSKDAVQKPGPRYREAPTPHSFARAVSVGRVPIRESLNSRFSDLLANVV
jgi:hypothetical protein